MHKIRKMTLTRIQARFPQLAAGVGCISPFIRLFDRHSACVVGRGVCIRIRSHKPLKSFHPGAKHWTAFIYPDHVSVHASSTVRTVGPIEAWSVVQNTSKKLDLLDFTCLLVATSKKPQAKSAIAHTPVRQVSKKKPAGGPVAKRSSPSSPSRAPRAPRSSGTP
jgi:hypothetical protein